MVFDNEALEEFQDENPLNYLPPPEQPPPSPTLPDIEELRRQLRMTPAPEEGEMIYEAPFVELKNPNPFKANPFAEITMEYEMKAFNSVLHLEPLNKAADVISILKNEPSKEKISILGGEYKFFGEFWLKREPDRKITVSLGRHSLKNRYIYNITLGRDFERELLYQLEIRKIEDKKSDQTGAGNAKP